MCAAHTQVPENSTRQSTVSSFLRRERGAGLLLGGDDRGGLHELDAPGTERGLGAGDDRLVDEGRPHGIQQPVLVSSVDDKSSLCVHHFAFSFFSSFLYSLPAIIT